MMRARFALFLPAIVAIACAPACGGASKSAAPAEAPSAASGASGAPSDVSPQGYPLGQPPAPPSPSATQAPVLEGAPTTPGTTTGPADAPESREISLKKAGGEFDAAQRSLAVAAGDCVAACRALGSMDRATGHLCAMVQAQDERAQCEDAKTKVRGAREKVRTTCGACPGGVTVDRNAPIPTPR